MAASAGIIEVKIKPRIGLAEYYEDLADQLQAEVDVLDSQIATFRHTARTLRSEAEQREQAVKTQQVINRTVTGLLDEYGWARFVVPAPPPHITPNVIDHPFTD